MKTPIGLGFCNRGKWLISFDPTSPLTNGNPSVWFSDSSINLSVFTLDPFSMFKLYIDNYISIIHFGTFTNSSGSHSPIYFFYFYGLELWDVTGHRLIFFLVDSFDSSLSTNNSVFWVSSFINSSLTTSYSLWRLLISPFCYLLMVTGTDLQPKITGTVLVKPATPLLLLD